MNFSIADPLRNFPTNKIIITGSEPFECILSLFALQNPESFSRGRQWRQKVLPRLEHTQKNELNFFFPEGYFSFNMGVFAAFLHAPQSTTVEDFAHNLLTYAQENPPQAMPVKWKLPADLSLESVFEQSQMIDPPAYLVDRFNYCLQNQATVLQRLIDFLKQYVLVFRELQSFWEPSISAAYQHLKEQITSVSHIDLIDFCSQGSTEGLDNYVAKKIRSHDDVSIILLPSFFSYPHIANLNDEREDSPYYKLLHLAVPVESKQTTLAETVSGNVRHFTDKELGGMFKALADETRLAILDLLKRKKLYGLEVANALGISQPNASHHLNYLAKQNLIKSEKEGTYIYFSINPDTMQQLYSDLAQKLL